MTQAGVRCRKQLVQRSAEAEPSKVSKLTIVFVLIGFIFCAGIMYIFQVNKLATMGYEIREKEKQIGELKKKNETLQIKAAELRSMQSLEADSGGVRMEKPTSVTYIEITEPVAMK